MIKRRRRFKQTLPLRDRLTQFAAEARARAYVMAAGTERSALLRNADEADRAIAIELWLASPGLQPPR